MIECCKLLYINFKVIVGHSTCANFGCGTITHVKLLLHWSVIYFQVTFECCSGCSSERCIKA